MATRGLLDVILFASSIVLGAILVVSSDGPTTDELIARRENIFSVLNPEEIKEIKWKSSKSPLEVRLRHAPTTDDPQRYFLGESGEQAADGETIRDLLDSLDFAAWSRTLNQSSLPPQTALGFDDPQLELRVDAGPRSYRLLFGKAAPSPANSVYAQIEGRNTERKTGVVEKVLLEKLLREEQEFRGGVLIPFSRSRTSTLRIESQDQVLRLKADELGFQLLPESGDAPAYRADRIFVDLIFYQLARAKIQEFMVKSAVKPLFERDKASLSISASSPDGPDHTIHLGGQCPHDKDSIVALRTAPDEIAGCVTRSILAAFRTPRQKLIDHSAFPLNGDEIDHVVVREGRMTLDLLREGVGFRLSSKDEEKLSLKVGNEFLEAVASAQLRLLPLPPAMPHAPLGTLLAKGQSPPTVASAPRTSSSSERIRELSCEIYQAPTDSNIRLLKRLDDGAWFEIPSSLNWAFSADDSWGRNRSLSKWQSSQINSVQVTLKDGWTQTVTRKDTGFSLAHGGTKTADGPLSRKLFDELSHLEALRFLSSQKKQTLDPQMKIDFTWMPQQGASSKHESLWLGSRTRGGYLAWATFAKGIFVLPLYTPQILSTPLLDRAALDIDSTRLLEVEISTPTAKYSFVRTGGELRASGDQALEEMVPPLQEALNGLKVISAARKGAFGTGPRNKPPLVTLKGKRLLGDQPSPFVIHIVGANTMDETSVAMGWLEGTSDNYIIDRRSVNMLLQLL